MTVTLRGRDERLGIQWEVSGSTPGHALKDMNELIGLLAAEVADTPGKDTCTSPLQVAAPDPVLRFKKEGPGVYSEVSEPAPEVTPEVTQEVDDEPPRPKEALPKPPAKVPAPAPTGAVCEMCGTSVSAHEEKTSRLFISKIVCRACLQKV